jgi:xanthine dehydrogenase YagR molybdenum-binding subunit
MSIGEPLPRPDGPDKVTGRARYAADWQVPHLLHGVFVTSAIPAGRINEIDASGALEEAGVIRVLTHRDMPRLVPFPTPPVSQTFLPMQSDEIRYEGQPIAIVLGETLEAVEAGAQRVGISYAASPARFPVHADWHAIDGAAVAPRTSGFLEPFFTVFEPEYQKGDGTSGEAESLQRMEASYLQPSRHHNPIEPSAVVAMWEGEDLTLYDSTQHVYGVQRTVAAILGIPPERMRVISKHTGGGFGTKGWIWPQEILAPAAAKIAGRPVKLVLRRADMYSFLGYQPRIAHRMALAADDAGHLTALGHDVVNVTTVTDDFVEFSTEASKSLYASKAMRLRQRVERANVSMPTPMRAPVEGPGLWGLESAMDELALALRMDPLDLRLANYAEVEPSTGKRWSSKKLREAYEEGARLFGWRQRQKGGERDGDWLLGRGMASCLMGTFRNPSGAEVHLKDDGTAVVVAGFQDIGTGTLTIMPQIAAGVLGLPLASVTCEMGDSRLPEAGPTYGSSSTMGVGAAVMNAAEDARSKLARLANLPHDDVEMKDGRIRRKGASDGPTIAEAMRAAATAEIVGVGKFDPAQHGKDMAMRAFGAVFVEVAVDPELGLLRLRRAVGSYSAGRIVNPRTAKAQMVGGIVWGWGMAAMEQSRHEPNLGRFLSKNLAGVAIPVNADIPEDVIIHFVDEMDEHASPIGGRGIGELGATGVAAAVANAVFDATGKRIRDLPITPDKLVG